MGEWIEVFNQSLEQFWKVAPITVTSPLILRLDYDVDWDEWEQHNKYYKSYGRLRLIYNEDNLLVSPSESFYPKVEEEVRIIPVYSGIPPLKISVAKFSYNGDKFINQTLLPWGVKISQLA